MMARILSLFLLIIFAVQSWGLVAPSSSDSYRYDGSRITENPQNRDYHVVQKSLGDGIRLAIEAFSGNVQGESFFTFVDGFFVTKGGGQELLPAPKAIGPKGNTNSARKKGTIFVTRNVTRFLRRQAVV